MASSRRAGTFCTLHFAPSLFCTELRPMEFGKLPSIDVVNFSLPPDPPQNEAVLQSLRAAPKAAHIYLGVTGYNMKEWLGRWYPPGAKTKDYLRFYGQQFNTIEHNTTHYRIPDQAMVQRWRDEVPDDFRYCPKLPQSISHAGDLGINGPETRLFCEAIAGLDEKLGCCFIQVPPYFKVQQAPALERFLEQFPLGDIPLAVEVRHESFFEPGRQVDAFFQMLEKQEVATVITDVAGRRDVCHMRLTSKRVLIRFVGNGLHPTDYSRVEDWARRLSDWFRQGLREVYFFCHEPDNLLAPDLAEFAARVFADALPEAVLRGPSPVRPAPQQGTLF